MRKYLFLAYKVILFGLSALVLTRGSIFQLPQVGLDPSWRIGINLAVVNRFTFGKDIIFTYGPLGYLHTRLPIGVTKTEYLLWDAFFALLFLLVLFYAYKHLQNFFAVSMAFLGILIFSRSSVSVETLFLPFLFLLFYHLKYGSLITLALASALSLIMFYIKLSVGLVVIVLMLVYLMYQFLSSTGRSRKFLLGFAILFLGTILLSSQVLNTDLPGYVWGGLQLANSYNDAMYINVKFNPFALPATYLALGSIIPFALVIIWNLGHLKQDHASFLRVLYVSCYVFFLFKYSFVRADWHMLNFFQSIPLAVGLLAFYSARPLSTQLAGVMGVTIFLSLPYATGIYDLKDFSTRLTTLPAQELFSGTVAHIKQKYQGASVYVSQAFETGNNLSPPPIPNAELPDRFLSRIGAQSVDIVPWEVAYVYANHLTYNPRPVFQSYQAYNGYLDLQNRDKYVSDSSPEYILFLADSIDNQHPSFIESKTRLAMLTHYQYIDHEGDLILLQKRSEPLDHIELSPLIKYGRLDQDISIEQTDDLLMMSFDIQYSLAGQLKRIFYQPPPLYVTLKFDDGDAREYKAIKSVINGEVLANRLIDQTNRAIKFFQESGNPDKRITAIRFHSPEEWGFVDEFVYSIKRVKLQ